MESTGDKRTELLRIAEVFGARAVDSTQEFLVFEITDTTDKLDSFIDLMGPLGLIEIARTGVVGIGRGASVP